MPEPKQPQQLDFNAWMATVLQQAHDIGYASGFDNGVTAGYALALQHTQAAVSDGLQNGSSECGKNMRSRRKALCLTI
ncbi:hypothetical protein M568_00635 [Salmonella enterica subsp. enterica serovar Namur str. 05-2929]|uniref:hypothetical protein n=1 Tax=Salmonella enterica TaxID=28901 RepID=UPI0004344992|nr:hypothetical protein [Salmonella enterica]EDQ9893576.1 hypothetical protein [Salmonella enterica subsp. enterica]EXX84523.1 hypothetical protein M568_00635 [Salmonella enterica subsp. enterica serovar Namur str. 05-2929]